LKGYKEMADLKRTRKGLYHHLVARLAGLWLAACGASFLCAVLTSLLFAGPFNVYYNWQTGKFTVISNSAGYKETKNQPRPQLLALLSPNPFQPAWLGSGGGAPQMTPTGLTQVSVAAFDPVNNALRIRGGVTPPSGQATPSDADQVFTSIFDTTYDALRVNCVVGCGGGSGGSPGGGNTAVQFNSSGAFGGDTTNFYYNATTHSLGVTGGLALGAPLGVSSGGTGTTSPSLTSGSNISVSGAWPNQAISLAGVIPSSDLPAPTQTTLGGVKAAPTISHEWINSISTAGVPALSQPAFSDLSGTAGLSQLPSTLAQYGGTVTVGDCAKWSSSGVLADAGAACGSGSTAPGGGNTAVQFNSSGSFGGDTTSFYYNTTTHSLGVTGGLTLGTPLGVSSGGTGTTSPALAAGPNISISGTWPNQTISFTGVIPSSDLPAPTQTALGGVEAAPAILHEWINSISTAGVPALSQPGFFDLTGVASLSQLPSTLAQYSGTITAGDCAKWSSSGTLADAGAACGSGGSTLPGGTATQYQFNNTTFGGAVSTYNATTAESTFPNLNNVYYVDGAKYATVEAVTADPNFKGGTIVSTVPETFASNPFYVSGVPVAYPTQIVLPSAGGTNVWLTNVHINIPAQDKLVGSGSAATILRAGASFPAEITAPLPVPGALTAGTTGTLGIGYLDVVYTAANGNGETTASSQASIQFTTGSTNSATLPAPGAIVGASGMNVYGCFSATAGCSAYLLIAANQPLTSAYTITSIPAGQTLRPPSINTSASLVSLAEGGAPGAAGQFTRVEDLQIDCNGIAGGIGLFNRAAQEQSGASRVQVKNCLAASIDVEGPGAQNSSYNHLVLGGTQAAATIGFRDDSATIRGLNDVTIAPPPAQPQGAVAIDLINTTTAPLGCYRDIHIENFADGLFTNKSPACIENISGFTNVGNLVHFDVNSYDDEAKGVINGGATNSIKDDVFSYLSGSEYVGMYWIGKGTGTARSRYSSEADVIANFQGGLTSAVPIPVSSGGNGTATPALLAGSNIAVTGSWPNQTISFSGALPATQGSITNEWLNSYNASTGAFTAAQPAFSNLSGLIVPAQVAAGPVVGDCPSVATGAVTFTWAACAGGTGSPGGLTTQYQINDAGAFGAAAALANSLATGVGTVIASQAGSGGTDIPAFRVIGFPTSPASDKFQVAATGATPGNTCSGTVNCAVWVDASGNLNFLGNTAKYGPAATASSVTIYGSNASLAPAFFGIVSSALSVPAAPTLASAGGGTIAATTYYAKITYLNGAGETVGSGESSLAVAADNLLVVDSPLAYINATGWNVYVSTATGAETKQNTGAIAIGTNWTEPAAGLISGAALPASNTTGGLNTTNLYASTSIAGLDCTTSSVPNSDCGPGVSGSSYIPTAAGATTPVTGDCVKWISSTQIGDQGAACGSGGGGAWSAMTTSLANLTLSMAGFTTTFNWTNAALGEWGWDASGNTTLANTEAAVSGTNVNSPGFSICGQVWGGGTPANIQDCWKLAVTYGTSINPTSTFNFTHIPGSTGTPAINLPNNTIITDTGGSFTLQQLGINVITSENTGVVTVDNPIQIQSAATAQYYSINLKATAALTAGELVCLDSANASSMIVCPTTTTDQFIGFAPAAIAAGVNGPVAIQGSVINALMGTATCAIGNWVIADTTTAGDVKCSTTAPASGDQVGWAMTAQATVGAAMTVLIDKR